MSAAAAESSPRPLIRRLPKTTGFFFGESDGSEQEDDLEFIAKAREALAADKFVYYTSWW